MTGKPCGETIAASHKDVLNWHVSVLSSSGLTLAAQALAKVFGFFFLVYIARTLGVVDYGTYAFISALLALLSVVHDLGLNAVTTRGLARSDNRIAQLFWTNIVLRVPIGIALAGIVAGFLTIAGRRDAVATGVILSLAVVPTIIGQVVNSIFIAFERFRWMAGLVVFGTAVTIASGYLALVGGRGLFGLATANLVAAIITAMVTVAVLVRSNRVLLRPVPVDLGEARRILRESFPIALSLLFVTFYYKIDRILIGLLLDARSVGVYDVAYRFIDGLMIIPNSLMVVIFPMLSRVLRKEGPDADRAIQRSARWMFAVGLPTAIILSSMAPSIVAALFGPSYIESGRVLQVLIWAVAFMFPNALFGNALVAADRQRVLALIVGIGVAINVVLNLVLIPLIGLYGAALATVVVEVWGFAGVTYYLGLHLRSYDFLGQVARPALVSCALGLMLLVAGAVPIAVLLPMSLAACLLLSFAFGSFSIDELKAFAGVSKISEPAPPSR